MESLKFTDGNFSTGTYVTDGNEKEEHMDNPFKNAIEEFKKLPTSGKIAVVGAIASIVALVIMTRGSGTSSSTTPGSTTSSNPLAGLGGNSDTGTVATAVTPATVAPITYPWEIPSIGGVQTFAPATTTQGALGASIGQQAANVFKQSQNVGTQLGTAAGNAFVQSQITNPFQATQVGSTLGAAAAKSVSVTPAPSQVGSILGKSTASVLSTNKAVKSTSAPTYTPTPINPIVQRVAPGGSRVIAQ